MSDLKYRPDASERWVNDRTEPVRIDLRTKWLYSEEEKHGYRGDSCICCPGRHAFARGGSVTRSDVPSPYSSQQDTWSHVQRAIQAFGDDANLVIEVRRTDPEAGGHGG